MVHFFQDLNTSATIIEELRNTFQNAGEEVEKSLVSNLKLDASKFSLGNQNEELKIAENTKNPFIVHAQPQRSPATAQQLKLPVTLNYDYNTVLGRTYLANHLSLLQDHLSVKNGENGLSCSENNGKGGGYCQ